MIAPASTASAKRQQELDPEWLAALADAQVADDDAVLYILAGEASNVGRGAAYLSPAVHLVDPSDQELAAAPRGLFEDQMELDELTGRGYSTDRRLRMAARVPVPGQVPDQARLRPLANRAVAAKTQSPLVGRLAAR